MARVLIAYFTSTGTTEKMANYVAEGVRIAGHEAEVKKVSEIKSEKDFAGYGAYIFGCPTYHLDMPGSLKASLVLAGKAGLQGKIGGAFSCRTHPSSEDGGASAEVFKVMERDLKMTMTSLGPFDIKAELIDSMDGMHTCQDYGKAIAEMLR